MYENNHDEVVHELEWIYEEEDFKSLNKTNEIHADFHRISEEEFMNLYPHPVFGKSIPITQRNHSESEAFSEPLEQKYVAQIPEQVTKQEKDEQKQCKKKRGRKSLNEGFKTRKDVVLKTLLRKMHRFFWHDFNVTTKYMKIRRDRRVNFFETCLESYIHLKINAEATHDLTFLLGCITNSKEMEKSLHQRTNNRPERIKAQLLKDTSYVYDILYNFTVSKLTKLTKKQEFFTLFTYFSKEIESVQNSDEIKGLKIFNEKWRDDLVNS